MRRRVVRRAPAPLVALLLAALLVGCTRDASLTAPTSPALASTSTATAAPRSVPPSSPGTTSATTGFRGSVSPIPADVRAGMTGRSWRPGCPVGFDELRLLQLSYWDLGGAVRQGRLVVHRDHADEIVGVFQRLFEARFPIERMELVDRFGADDDASMAANNTSAFNCRPVSGTDRYSEHAYGRAVDLNPRFNPWVHTGRVDPPNGAPYVDRARERPGMISAGDAVVTGFAAIGWVWAGLRQSPDYQHFSPSGR